MATPTQPILREPPPRYNHSSVTINQKVYAWGGKWSKEPQETMTEFDGEYRQIRTTGEIPNNWIRSACASIGSTIYSWGGYGRGRRHCNDFYCIDVEVWQWRRVIVKNPGMSPPGKIGSQMVACGSNLAVVGGETSAFELTNDIHVFNTTEGEWTKPEVQGTPPPPSAFFTLTKVDDNFAVYYGGITSERNKNRKIYLLNLKFWEWSLIKVDGPPGRNDHSTCLLTSFPNPQLLVTGGKGDSFEHLKDAWVLEVDCKNKSAECIKVVLSEDAIYRSGHTTTAIWSSNRSVMVVVDGGQRGDYTMICDIRIIYMVVEGSSTSRSWKVIEVVSIKDNPERGRELGIRIQRLNQLPYYLRTRKLTNSRRSACMVFNGPPRGGKSTIIHRLVHDLSAVVSVLHLPSSPIMEKPMRVRIEKIKQTKAAIREDKSWVEQTLEQETERALRKAIVDDTPEYTNSERTESEPVQESNQIPAKERSASSTDYKETKTRQLSKQASETNESRVPHFQSMTNLQTIPTAEPPDEVIHKALLTLGALKDSDDLDGSPTLQICDTGGQPEFQSMLPWLLVKSAITVQVFNLRNSLEERFEVQYESEEGQAMVPYKSSFTTEEVLFQAQSSITLLDRMHNVPELPFEVTPIKSKSLFLGTHYDLVKDEDLYATNRNLKQKLKCSPVLDDKVVYHDDPEFPDVVIPIDNTDPDDPGIRYFRECVFDILNEMPPGPELPVSWEWFRLSLLSTGEKTMSVNQCTKIGKASGMESKKEVQLALWFHTQFTGQIKYCEIPGIEDTVWLDPHIITDGMSMLIASSFRMKGTDRRNIRYRETGKFPVDEIRRNFQKHCPELYEKIIVLFEYLHILSPITNECNETVEYFVPCVLQPTEVEGIKRVTPSANHPPALLFTFETGFTPLGVFHALVVHLSSAHNKSSRLQWQLCESSEGQFRNKVIFCVGQDPDEVTLIDRPQFIEVWVDREQTVKPLWPFSDVCNEVYLTINAALDHVKLCKNPSIEVSHSIAFYCERQTCDGIPHLARVEEIPPSRTVCSVSERVCGIQEYHTMWFKEVDIEASASAVAVGAFSDDDVDNRELDEDDQQDVLEAIIDVVKWKNVGRALGLKESTLKKIKAENKDDIDECKAEMVDAWLNHNVCKKGKPTWKELVLALRSRLVNEHQIADAIAKERQRTKAPL